MPLVLFYEVLSRGVLHARGGAGCGFSSGQASDKRVVCVRIMSGSLPTANPRAHTPPVCPLPTLQNGRQSFGREELARSAFEHAHTRLQTRAQTHARAWLHVQVGFYDIVVIPLFHAFVRVFPGSRPLLTYVMRNYKVRGGAAGVCLHRAWPSLPSVEADGLPWVSF